MAYQGIEKVEPIGQKASAPQVELPVWPKARREESPREKAAQATTPDPALKIDTQLAQGILKRTYTHFIIDNETNRIRAQVVNADNGEVIQEIPSEELAKLAADLRAYMQAVSEHRR
ncbi:MAG: flagellar protein FlaG [Chloroflexi bacterium]|nr:flagellar protein FlaG [Chloroflexota bacterium]